jgi:hypothetical protein
MYVCMCVCVCVYVCVYHLLLPVLEHLLKETVMVLEVTVMMLEWCQNGAPALAQARDSNSIVIEIAEMDRETCVSTTIVNEISERDVRVASLLPCSCQNQQCSNEGVCRARNSWRPHQCNNSVPTG